MKGSSVQSNYQSVNQVSRGNSESQSRSQGLRGRGQGRGGQDHNSNNNSQTTYKPCYKCGRDAHSEPNSCPAKDKTCNHYGILGHYATVCRKKAMQDNDSTHQIDKTLVKKMVRHLLVLVESREEVESHQTDLVETDNSKLMCIFSNNRSQGITRWAL